jgi:hemerythrin-like metal-binding protein
MCDNVRATSASAADAMDSIDIFPWDDNFNTGLPNVDEQHRKLVDLLNLLASYVAFGADIPRLNAIFDELSAYAVYHFETEEAIWHRYLADDPEEVEHKQIHARFIETVQSLRAGQGSQSIAQTTEDALSFLVRWLVSHILQTDRRMAYVVHALQNGQTLDEARRSAEEKMGGATRAMIDIILSIYGTLSSNTLRLMREITAHRQVEAELREATRRAEDANLAKSQFLATMSHEIRTPLNGVLGMAQLLLLPDIEPEERMEFARTIISSGTTLLTLLNDVLDLSKVEAGKMELISAAFDPVQLLDEVAALMVENAASRGLALAVHWQGNPAGHYRGDPIRIRQMLSNLIGNAIKFTEQGQVIVKAGETRRTQDDGRLRAHVRFTVTDSGIGIPADKIERLFEPFSQVDASETRRYGGTGLGLSIVRSLAERMGGVVGVSSEAGRGSSFWFELPLDIVEAGANMRAFPRSVANVSAALPAPAENARILLVEDNTVNRLVIERMLVKQGFKVITATNGQLALDMLDDSAQAPPDLVLMDVQMPVMDGLEATRRIRAREQATGACHLPIVALTANAFEQDRNHCLAVGMDDFLAKPVNADRLRETIIHWLTPPV